MRKNYVGLILLGILLGLGVTFSLQIFLPLFLISCILIYVWGKSHQEERRFLVIVLIAALSLRILLLLPYYYFYLLPGNMDILGIDGEAYQARGWYISRFLLGQNIYTIPSTEQIFWDYNTMVDYYGGKIPLQRSYQVGIMSYSIAPVYAAFGYAPLMLKLINSIFSLLTGLIIYSLGKKIFSQQVGKISMSIFLFLPSIVLGSITALKDPAILFFSMVIVWSLVKMKSSFRFKHLLLISLSLFLLYFLRKFAALIFLVLIGTSFLCFLRIGIFKKILLISLAGLLLFNLPVTKENMQKNLRMEVLTNMHVGYVNTPAGHNYKIFPDDYYRSGKMSVFAFFLGWSKGVFHFLFEPLPWNIKSKAELLSLLQNIFWYFLFIFVLLGIVIAIRNRFSNCTPAIIYILLFVLAFGLSEGNVGTAFRHRDSLNPVFIIFGIAGLMNVLGRLKLCRK